jgi:uncharacterized 2Fe-2S/4Fe-4S cluster protein (DUF4445 family)
MSPKGVFEPRAPSIDVHPRRDHVLAGRRLGARANQAANTVGQWILLRELGIDPADVDRLYLAGGFAAYVDARNAIDIGFLAPVPIDRIEKVGNASLRGAKRLLLSASARRHLAALIPRIEHIELETTPDFFELFVDACQFKPLPDRLAGSRSRVAS